jgi:hypothetical protein
VFLACKIETHQTKVEIHKHPTVQPFCAILKLSGKSRGLRQEVGREESPHLVNRDTGVVT